MVIKPQYTLINKTRRGQVAACLRDLITDLYHITGSQAAQPLVEVLLASLVITLVITLV